MGGNSTKTNELKEKKHFTVSDVALVLAGAVNDPSCPACEVFSNPWLFRDIVELLKSPVDHIMISGGFGLEASTEIYSISKNSWKLGPDMPHSRSNHGMALAENKIFVVGGRKQGHATSWDGLSIQLPFFHQ